MLSKFKNMKVLQQETESKLGPINSLLCQNGPLKCGFVCGSCKMPVKFLAKDYQMHYLLERKTESKIRLIIEIWAEDRIDFNAVCLEK